MKRSPNSNTPPSGDQFDLLKNISDRLSTLEHNFYKMTKQHKSIQKTLQTRDDTVIPRSEIEELKYSIIEEMKQEIGIMIDSEGKSKRGKERVNSQYDEEDFEDSLRVIKKIQDDIGKLKEDATETYKIATRALKQIDTYSKGKFSQAIDQHLNNLLDDSMNQVMKIIRKYIEDQSAIKLDIEALKQQVFSKEVGGVASVDKNSPKMLKAKKALSVSQTTDKKSNRKGINKWDGGSSDQKTDSVQEKERERIMTQTEANKSSKQIQRLSDLKEKLKQFEIINEKYKSGKKEKEKQLQKQKQKEKKVERQSLEKYRQSYKQRKSQKKQYIQREKSEKKSVELSKTKKEGTEVIDQLKKFKNILENTESQIDISNPINVDSTNLPSYTKYTHLSKLYSGTK